ncbi:hypothetical protein ES706_04716 [subsurface metagenome]
MIIYPWTNLFDTIFDDLFADGSSDSQITYRERYRKISGSSIISPFEYSLSIDDAYTLKLSYRLNERNYIEKKFTIDYSSDGPDYIYDFMPYNFNDYVNLLEKEGDSALKIYYYDQLGKFNFLDESYYEIISSHEVKLLPKNGNPITTPFNNIDDFWISFNPEFNDVEYDSYEFTYDPTKNLEDTISLSNWYLNSGNDLVPNLDVPYFMNDLLSTPTNYVCHASQIASYIDEGDWLSFDIKDELGSYAGLMSGIQNGGYLTLFIEAIIKNYESLKKIEIRLIDNGGIFDTQEISIEDLIMNDFTIIVDLTSATSTFKTIQIKPVFRTDAEYDSSNNNGIARFETVEWDEAMTFYDLEGNKYMNFTLFSNLLTNSSDLELAYLFNEYLEYLDLPDGVQFGWGTNKDRFGNIDSYVLQIPNIYKNPDNHSETLTFKDGDLLVVRYNSPIIRGIGLGIGKMYFEKRPDFFELGHVTEFIMINVSDSTDYSQFVSPYSYNIPLSLTPFNTEFSNTFKTLEFDIDLASLFGHAVDGMIDFSHIVFSVPDPSYELTIDQVSIIKKSQDLSAENEELFERVWQYSEFEMFTSDDDPTDDVYELTNPVTPLFFSEDKWLNYLMIYDDNYDYYSAGIAGSDDYQLIGSASSKQFTWNPSFDRFQDYWGMEIELPMNVEPNTNIYFSYCTNESWQTPIILDYENINMSSLDIIYEDVYYMIPKYEGWFGEVYENSDYDYVLTQYYGESFIIYPESEYYIHKFDLDYSLEDDFNST